MFRQISAEFGVTTGGRSSTLTCATYRDVLHQATRQEERQQIFEGFAGILLLRSISWSWISPTANWWDYILAALAVLNPEKPGSRYFFNLFSYEKCRNQR